MLNRQSRVGRFQTEVPPLVLRLEGQKLLLLRCKLLCVLGVQHDLLLAKESRVQAIGELCKILTMLLQSAFPVLCLFQLLGEKFDLMGEQGFLDRVGHYKLASVDSRLIDFRTDSREILRISDI